MEASAAEGSASLLVVSFAGGGCGVVTFGVLALGGAPAVRQTGWLRTPRLGSGAGLLLAGVAGVLPPPLSRLRIFAKSIGLLRSPVVCAAAASLLALGGVIGVPAAAEALGACCCFACVATAARSTARPSAAAFAAAAPPSNRDSACVLAGVPALRGFKASMPTGIAP